MAQTNDLRAQISLGSYGQVSGTKDAAGQTTWRVQSHPDNGVLRAEEDPGRTEKDEQQHCNRIPDLRGVLPEDQGAPGAEEADSGQEVDSAGACIARCEEAGSFSEGEQGRTEQEARSSIDSLPEFCTSAELSLILPVSRATLYRMAEQKRIPSLQIGRRVIIPRESFRKWMEQECYI